MNNNLHKKILDSIREDKLSPIPKWHFVARELFVWIGLLFTLTLSAIVLAFGFFQGGNYQLLPPTYAPLFLLLSLSVIASFIFLSVYQIKKTKNGYKKNTWKYITVSILIALVLAVAFFSVRLHDRLESLPGARLLGGRETINRYWSDPQEGLLAGEFKGSSFENLLFIDLQENEHRLNLDNLNEPQQKLLERFLKVRMVGYEQDEIFYPCSVVPWEIRGAKPKKRLNGDVKERRGNIDFQPRKKLPDNLIKDFKKTFEIKSDIVRSNRCQ